MALIIYLTSSHSTVYDGGLTRYGRTSVHTCRTFFCVLELLADGAVLLEGFSYFLCHLACTQVQMRASVHASTPKLRKRTQPLTIASLQRLLRHLSEYRLHGH